MANYSVNKYFGHFHQIWCVQANSEDEAWKMAEKNGKLQYQSVFREPTDISSKGYIVNLDEKKEELPIQEEQYYTWMREAISKGMSVTAIEYKKAFGISFQICE